ncbi:taste receptor type 2 member 39 [Xenopus laevis]|uniref:Taste receptor type 2 n=2 Tax=Xenopus laevis TaxID=8355 RepID=A0A8J0VEP6_XENLA|nr:taste receptor type 2 member 39 [Xenopus laevis]
MLFPIYFTVFIIMMLIVGLAVNAFISIFNMKSWSREGKFKPSDKILTALCFIRFFLQCDFMMEIFGIWLELIPLSEYKPRCIFYFIQLFMDFFSRWLSAWLSMLYYVKITIFKNAFFLQLQSLIPRITGYVIFISIFISFVPGLIYSLSAKQGFCMNANGVNVTTYTSDLLTFRVIAFFFGHSLPFLLEMLSSIYLLCTLFAHIRHTKSYISNFTEPNMDVHWTVFRYILLLNLMSTCNFFGNFFLWSFISNFIGTAIGYFLAFSYPTSHSIVLILSNPKLKREVVNMFHCATKLWRFNKQESETVTQ